MSTVNPMQSTTYSLLSSNNPITFGAATDINAAAQSAGIYGGAGPSWKLTNQGSVTGYNFGVQLLTKSSVTNSGHLNSDGYGYGVFLMAGGTLSNLGGGQIDGGYKGVRVQGGSGAVTNAGSITSSGQTGVSLGAGGSVNNLSGGTIQGENYGLTIDGGIGKVTNAGSISSSYTGLHLSDGGSVANLAGGTLSGFEALVVSGGQSAKITNAGLIQGTSARGNEGVVFQIGGSVVNQAGGVIDANYGVDMSGGGKVTNAGQINAAYFGVELGSGGEVTNAAGGAITAGGFFGENGVGVGTFGGIGKVTNAGSIEAVTYGVELARGGNVTNQAGGLIQGSYAGVSIAALGGMVINSGTISGYDPQSGDYGASVQFTGVGKNILTLLTGSVLKGDAFGSTAAGATNALNLDGDGGVEDNDFHNFNTLAVKAAGAWTLQGSSSFGSINVKEGTLQIGDASHPVAELDGPVTIKDGSLIVYGTVKATALINTFGGLFISGGLVDVSGPVTGTGFVDITSGTLRVESSFNQRVGFDGATGLLDLAQSQSYTGPISGFSHTGGTQIDLRDIKFVSPTEATFSGTTSSGTLTVTDGGHAAHITLLGNYMSSTFVASSDGHGGTLVHDPASGSSAIALASPAAH